MGSRSFKWGTKHWFWSRGCKDIRGQSWRSKKISARAPDSRPMHPGPAVSADIFFDLQLWPLISSQPLDQNQCLVLHMKDLLRICLEVKGQGFWMTFKVCNHGSQQPYFDRAYVVRGYLFSATIVSNNADLGSLDLFCHPVKVLSLSSKLLFDCSSAHCDAFLLKDQSARTTNNYIVHTHT